MSMQQQQQQSGMQPSGNKQFNVLICGAGAFGTALANTLSRNRNLSLILYDEDQEVMQQLKQNRVNDKHLPGVHLSNKILFVNNLNNLQLQGQQQQQQTRGGTNNISGIDLLINCVPVTKLTSFIQENKQFWQSLAMGQCNCPILLTQKGIDDQRNQFASDIFLENVGSQQQTNMHQRIAVLSGPIIAPELIRGQAPTTVLIASLSIDTAKHIKHILSSGMQMNQIGTQKTSNLFYVTSTDLVGAEVSNAVENVIALACGICEGIFNEQGGISTKGARAAIVAAGVHEVKLLADKLRQVKGQKTHVDEMCDVVHGLAGVGGLVLSGFAGKDSKHFQAGINVARGLDVHQQQQQTVGHHLEGLKSALALKRLSEQLNVELPVVKYVCEVLHGSLKNQKGNQLRESCLNCCQKVISIADDLYTERSKRVAGA